MIHLYVILSTIKDFRYVGITNDLDRRITEHNTGKSKSTRNRGPFKLILSEIFDNYEEARKREIFLKSGVGRKFLDNLK